MFVVFINFKLFCVFSFGASCFLCGICRLVDMFVYMCPVLSMFSVKFNLKQISN
jgi:hypothetical protein